MRSPNTSPLLFDPQKFSFGRHETFSLRYGWLTKGYKSLETNPYVFLNEDATVELGVGKNMVSSIRYWMLATRVIRINEGHTEPTEVGHAIFSDNGWDPYLEDEATIWLLHWLLASNSENATAIYWFFNSFHRADFSSHELFAGLLEFTKGAFPGKRIAESTLKNDCNMIIRQYVPSTGDKQTPVEDALDSPFSTLGLVHTAEQSHRYGSRPEERWDLPASVVGYALVELFSASDQSSLSLEDIAHGGSDMPGIASVFRITEECLVAKIEELIGWLPGVFEIRETAGIHLLFQLEKMDPIALMDRYYETYALEAVA